jgi:hypothetical protein
MSRARLAESIPEGRADVLGHCQSLLCGKSIPPIDKGWRRTERRFCCDECKQVASLIRRVGKLLEGLSDDKVLEVLGRKQ